MFTNAKVALCIWHWQLSMEDLLTTKTLASTMIIRTAIAIILKQVVLVNGGVHTTEPEI